MELIKYNTILQKILDILIDEHHGAHANIVHKTLNLIYQNSVIEFINEINTINFWGGSGAIWEIKILNKDNEEIFYDSLINLLLEMENDKILNPKFRNTLNILKKIKKQ